MELKKITGAFLISVSSGGVQFLVLSAFARRLGPASFSEFSYVVSLLAPYLLLVDLGLQTLLLRRWGLEPSRIAVELKDAMKGRCVLALVAICIVPLHGLFAGFDAEMMISSLAYMAILMPFAVLQTLEIVGFVRNRPFLSSASRLARLVGWLTAGAALFFSRGDPSKSILFFSMTVAAVMMTVLFFVFPMPGAFSGWKEGKSDEEPMGWLLVPTLLRQNWQFTASLGLGWLSNSLFLVFLSRTWEKASLGEYFLASNLMTPFALAAQLISSTVLARKQLGIGKRGSWLISCLLLGAILYISLWKMFPLFAGFFGSYLVSALVSEMSFNLGSVVVGVLGGILFVRAYEKGERIWMWAAPLIGIACILPLVFGAAEVPAISSVLNPTAFPRGAYLFLMQVAPVGLYLFLKLLRRTARKDAPSTPSV